MIIGRVLHTHIPSPVVDELGFESFAVQADGCVLRVRSSAVYVWWPNAGGGNSKSGLVIPALASSLVHTH